MRRREENNQDNRENTGKMSRLAKSVMAAGLAVGGATAFGDMSVFAAENGDGGDPGVTVDTNAQSDVEQHSVEIPTGVVSVSSEVTTTVSASAPAAAAPAPAAAEPAPVAATSAPATSEPALATTAPAPIVSESTSTTTPGTGNSVTTTETTKTEKDIYYVDPSTIGDYENVNETPGEGRTHLYDHETTTTTTTTTKKTSSEETVDVSRRKTENVKDIARDIAGDKDGDGDYKYTNDTKVSEDGKVTTETGSVVDKEVTFSGDTTTTTTTTADVTKITTTETKQDFNSEGDAENWAKSDGFSQIGNITENKGDSQETKKKDYASKEEAEYGAQQENPNATNIRAEEGEKIVGSGTVNGKATKEEAEEAAREDALNKGFGNPTISETTFSRTNEKSGTVTGKTAKKVQENLDKATAGLENKKPETIASRDIAIDDEKTQTKYSSKADAERALKQLENEKTGEGFEFNGSVSGPVRKNQNTGSVYGKNADEVSNALEDAVKGAEHFDVKTPKKNGTEKVILSELQDTKDQALAFTRNQAKVLENAGYEIVPDSLKVIEETVAGTGTWWDKSLDDDIEGVHPKGNWDNLNDFNYITTNGDLTLNQHTRGSVYVNGNLHGNGRQIDNTKDNETVPNSTTSYVNGVYDNISEWGRGNKFEEHVEKDTTVTTEDGTNSVQKYWNALAQKIASLASDVTKNFHVLDADADTHEIKGDYSVTSGDTLPRDGSNMPVYVYLGTGTVNLTVLNKGFWGILLAPNASVDLGQESNWCGTVVGKSITTSMEAHIWKIDSDPIKKWRGQFETQKYSGDYRTWGEEYSVSASVKEYSAEYSGDEGKWSAKWEGEKQGYKASYSVSTW